MNTAMTMNAARRPKVFCIGFQKTGTTSLYGALTTLGYRTAAVVGRDLSASQLQDRGAALCIETMADYDAAQDMPWPLFFRQLDAAFPGSKFILTVREPESWYRSIDAHFGAEPTAMGAFTYGDDAAAPTGARDRYIATYTAHNETVRSYFADRPDDFLEMDLARGDGWAALCGFLECDLPAAPFPVRNRREDRATLWYRLRRRLYLLFGHRIQPEEV